MRKEGGLASEGTGWGGGCHRVLFAAFAAQSGLQAKPSRTSRHHISYKCIVWYDTIEVAWGGGESIVEQKAASAILSSTPRGAGWHPLRGLGVGGGALFCYNGTRYSVIITRPFLLVLYVLYIFTADGSGGGGAFVVAQCSLSIHGDLHNWGNKRKGWRGGGVGLGCNQQARAAHDRPAAAVGVGGGFGGVRRRNERECRF